MHKMHPRWVDILKCNNVIFSSFMQKNKKQIKCRIIHDATVKRKKTKEIRIYSRASKHRKVQKPVVMTKPQKDCVCEKCK